jgi:DNA-binding winged helix-turn-helix (wHTH) protein
MRLQLQGSDVQFLFGDHMLDDDRRELRRGAEPIAIEPRCSTYYLPGAKP